MPYAVISIYRPRKLSVIPVMMLFYSNVHRQSVWSLDLALSRPQFHTKHMTIHARFIGAVIASDKAGAP